MRKITLAISMLALGSFVFAQQMSNAVERLSELTDTPQKKSEITQPKRGVDAQVIIFQETFDSTLWHTAIDEDMVPIPGNMPAGWTVVDLTGNNFYWRWSVTGPRGRYTSGQGQNAFIPNNNHKVKSTSDNSGGDRGFMMLEADYYNTNSAGAMVSPPVSMDSYVQYAVIDCSQNSAVNIYFEQWHRFCCASYNTGVGPKLYISNNGTDWTEIAVHQAGINQMPKTNPSIFEVPITSLAANQPTVTLRFHLKGESHYHWSFDDIIVYQPYPYDIRVKNYWVDYAEGKFAYYNNPNIAKLFSAIPYFNAYHALQPFVSARSLASNFGAYSMNNVKITTKIKKSDNTEVFSNTSAPLAISNPGATDSIESPFTYQMPRVLSSVGAYTLNGLLHGDEEDLSPGNNQYVYNFNVTENLFGFANPATVNTDRQSPFSYVGSQDGDGIGVIYMLNPPTEVIPGTTIPAPYVLRGVNVHINSDFYNWQIWEAGNVATLQARVYELQKDGSGNWITGPLTTPKIQSEQMPVDSHFVNTFMFIPFPQEGTDELITPTEEGHFYLVTIHMWTNGQRFFIGADKFIHPSFYGNWVMIGGDNDWGWVAQAANIGIELVVDKFGEDVTGGIRFEIMNQNPETGVTTGAIGALLTLYRQDPSDMSQVISEEFTISYDGVVEVSNLRSGSYVYTVEYQGEFKRGRVAVTGSGMTTATHLFSYNAITNSNMLSEVKMYPNPANDMLTLTNLNNVRRIQISNIVGQAMRVVDNPAATETINVSNYAAGVYMVTLFDNNGNVVTHRMVKR